MSYHYTLTPFVKECNEVKPKMDGCELVPCIPEQDPCKPLRQCHARNYYNPARNCVYSRYSECEWDQNNEMSFCLANNEKDISKRIRADAWISVKAADKLTRTRQCSNNRKLGERVDDISFWKEKLLKEMNNMDTEMENLSEHKRVLEKALHDSDTILSIVEECIIQREKRTGSDQVHDNPERGLCKELLLIKQCRERMNATIDRADMQLKMDRCVRHAIDIDIRDKHHAERLDDRMHQLRNCSFGIGFHPGLENTDNTVSNQESWMKFAKENIERSFRERQNSEKTRRDIDLCLRQCANDMWSQFDFVNKELKHNIDRTTHVKEQLQAHLHKINIEARDQERAIDLLRCAIAEKEFPMKVAQTRLDERTRRLCVEACHDEPMKGLRTEVYELRETIALLKEKLRLAEQTSCRLAKVRARLESEIQVKENTIQVDSRCILAMRKYMPLDPKVGPMFSLNECAKAGSKGHKRSCRPPEEIFSGLRICPPCAPTFIGSSCCY